MKQRYDAINGQTRIVAILGKSIGHTLSPLLHNQAMRELGLNGVYVPLDMTHEFPKGDFFEAMWEAGAWGFNVTVPFKEVAAQRFSPGQWQAVNTIYRGPSGWDVCSTDGPGFLRGLAELRKTLTDFEAVLLLGNGGAARSLAATFHEQQPQLPVYVLRRNAARDNEWRASGKGPLDFLPFRPDGLADLLKKYPRSLVVQTTSAPFHGEDLADFASQMTFFPGVCVDICYGQTSALLRRAQDLGVAAQDGLPMLIGQALLSQERWWGRSASFVRMEQFLRQALRH